MLEKDNKSSLVIKFKKLRESAILPRYAHSEDAGFDLFSLENYTLKPRERHVFNIGLASEIPPGYFVMLKPKSGLAAKGGIDVLAGVIDSSYRGEWGVVLINSGEQPFEFKVGDKICQGILLEIDQAEIMQVEDLSETERGEAGFGSTGNSV